MIQRKYATDRLVGTVIVITLVFLLTSPLGYLISRESKINNYPIDDLVGTWVFNRDIDCFDPASAGRMVFGENHIALKVSGDLVSVEIQSRKVEFLSVLDSRKVLVLTGSSDAHTKFNLIFLLEKENQIQLLSISKINERGDRIKEPRYEKPSFRCFS